jgi:chitodextrinase
VGANCAVTGYTVYKNGSPVATVIGSSDAVTGLTAATAYSFTVAAVDSFGSSAQSSPVSVTTASSAAGTPPGTYPVTVIATSGSITQTASFNVTVQ